MPFAQEDMELDCCCKGLGDKQLQEVLAVAQGVVDGCLGLEA
jgi:hypothetical protein